MPCDPIDQSKVDLVTGVPLYRRSFVGGGIYHTREGAIEAAKRCLQPSEPFNVRRNWGDTGWVWETI